MSFCYHHKMNHSRAGFALLSLFCGVASLRGAANDFNGTWTWTSFNGSMQIVISSLAVTVSGGAVSGQLIDDHGTYSLDGATISGDVLHYSFNVPASGGGTAQLKYDLTLTGDVAFTQPDASPLGQANGGYSTNHYTATRTDNLKITRQPILGANSSSGTSYVGSSPTTSVVASGASAYQWRCNGADLAGGTNAELTLSNVQLSQAGTYDCIVRNGVGGLLSSSVQLTVAVDPTQGSGSTGGGSTGGGSTGGGVTVLDQAIFPPLGSGARLDTTSNLMVAGSGAPSVSADTMTMTTAPILLWASTRIMTTGTNNSLVAPRGQLFGLETFATGTQPMTVQWSKNGAPIPGATKSVLRFDSVAASDAGRYECSVSNSFGTDHWAANLTVEAPPAIVEQTTAVSAAPGQPIALTVHATSDSQPLSFQWYHNGPAIPGATSGSTTASSGPADRTSTLNIGAMSAADQGTYWCAITNPVGSVSSTRLKVLFPPVIVQQPVGVTVKPGQSVTLSSRVTATGDMLQFQWYHNGVAIAGATAGSISPGMILVGQPPASQDATSSFSIPSVSAADAGDYVCKVTADGSATTTTAAAAVTVETAARIIDLATRLKAGGAAGKPICGFVMRGDAPMTVLLRAIGPTLANFGIAKPLPNPSLSFSADRDYMNDNWDASAANAIASSGAFPLPAGSKDAAIVATLSPKDYTANTTDLDGGEGIVLFEVYDTAPNTGLSRLVNASTRGFVGTGENAMFPGFVISGTGSLKIMLRAIGPGLRQFGVTDNLSDPQIQLYKDNVPLASNDDWSNGSDPSAIEGAAKSVGAFPLDRGSKDAVIVTSVSAGTYSAEVSGANGATGNALIELYLLP